MGLLFQMKRLLINYETMAGIFIFGFCSMFADFLSDISNHSAATVRFFGLILFLLILMGNFVLSGLHNPFMIPIMFTEEKEKSTSRNMFDKFTHSDKKLKNSSKSLERFSKLKLDYLILRLDNYNLRSSSESKDWIASWEELLREWEKIDRELMGKPFSEEGFCYHIYPHVVLPLAFALGASVNLRRPLLLYHCQNQEKFYKVIDLKDPREVSYESETYVIAPKTIPEDLNLDGGKKLILHIVISARHVENFRLHDDHFNATNVAIVYNVDLEPKDDWLPYVQEIVEIAKPLIHRYEDVDVCLICPSVVAFALGMAFSRKGSLKVCHYFSDGKYRPVFQLSEIEGHPPFS